MSCAGISCSNQTKDLSGLFQAKSIAIIGASSQPGKIGNQILKNLVEGGFVGDIYPINRHEEKIFDKKAYPIITDVPGSIDLAVIAIPAQYVPSALEECAQKHVRAVAVITSGFAEVGNVEAEHQLKELADKYNMALIGPNIFGVVYTPLKMNASFGPTFTLPGKIAFISQSGALAIALMGWTAMEKIGLASLVSVGNKADVDEKDLIEYFNHDPNVESVLIYMEGLKDGRRFLTTDIKKPVIVLKVGRSQRGAKAAASHTGSLAGSDKVYDAAFKQLGILRAKTFTQAFGWSSAFTLPQPQGDETIIVTNGGGIGVSTTDECEAAGITLLNEPEWLEKKFRETMPAFGSTKNPIDITGQGGAESYRKAAHIAFQEDKIKAVIMLYCETACTNPLEIARAIHDEYKAFNHNKPIAVAMAGGERTREAINYLNENHIPAFSEVREATSALKVLYTWRDISSRPKDNPVVGRVPKEAIEILERVKKEKRKIVLEHESRRILELCGVPMPKWGFAQTVKEAVKQAKGMYPLAMKIASPDIIHKSDVGGVVVNIQNEKELQAAFNTMMRTLKKKMPKAKLLGVNLVKMVKGIECIVGLSRDPQFGPVVMFGLGGVFVEALKDVSFRVVPFGKIEAQRLIDDIQSRNILNGFRGMKAHKPSVVKTICAIQKLAPLVKEIDINPLMTSQSGSYAVDARIIL